jgi:hypothetical protein
MARAVDVRAWGFDCVPEAFHHGCMTAAVIVVAVLLVMAPFFIVVHRAEKRRRLAEAWTGTVTSIHEQQGLTGREGVHTHTERFFVTVGYRRDDGTDGALTVSIAFQDLFRPPEAAFSTTPEEALAREAHLHWAVGDRIAKESGSALPYRLGDLPAVTR